MNPEAIRPNILRHPSAFLPIVMSLLAVTVILTHIVRFGTAPQADEGTSARLWQLLMGLQIPVIAFFAIRWLPQSPRSALFVLALQAAAAIAALAPVYLLHW
jgi:peptidoglycan/LPS O-acetylase OafA/YrhL